jgi:hypothetical protein
MSSIITVVLLQFQFQIASADSISQQDKVLMSYLRLQYVLIMINTTKEPTTFIDI